MFATIVVHFSRALGFIGLPKNHGWPFFGTPSGIFINPKTTGITFPVSRKFEVTILLRKSEGRKRPSKHALFSETIRWMLLTTSAFQNYKNTNTKFYRIRVTFLFSTRLLRPKKEL